MIPSWFIILNSLVFDLSINTGGVPGIMREISISGRIWILNILGIEGTVGKWFFELNTNEGNTMTKLEGKLVVNGDESERTRTYYGISYYVLKRDWVTKEEELINKGIGIILGWRHDFKWFTLPKIIGDINIGFSSCFNFCWRAGMGISF